MRVGIHQINYCPWLGYFNKIAKSDVFVLLDEVQLADNGMMHRNRILNKDGNISYITISFNHKHYMERSFCEIETNPNVDWQSKQFNQLFDSYHKAPFWDEVIGLINPLFHEKFDRVIDINLTAIKLFISALDINTKLVFQSSLEYDKSLRKDSLLIDLLKSLGADIYLSGTGAKKYMILEDFYKENIAVQFQTYESPVYPQVNSSEYIPGLSILDALFNCGIKGTRELFWRNIQENEHCE